MNFWQGKNVKLRAVIMSDLENYFTNNIDSEAERNGNILLAPVGNEYLREYVDKLSKLPSLSDELFLMIENRVGEVVGSITTHSCNKINGVFSYGIHILHKDRGNGYAKEAINLILKYYFYELRYRKAKVEIFSYNPSSIKLHENLGFILEGTLRKEHYTNGEMFDVHIYGLLKEEFDLKHELE